MRSPVTTVATVFTFLAWLGITGCQGPAADPTSPAGTTTTRSSVRVEDPGPHCRDGGIMIVRGQDRNGNGRLEPNEVTDVEYVCGHEPPDLIASTPEAPGTACAAGGQLVRWGRDRNHDGALTGEEIQGSAYVCNGPPGRDGLTTLAMTSPLAPGAQCPAGGTELRTGIDANRDGVLQAEEVRSTAFVCHGAQGPAGPTGATGLVEVDDEPAGTNCPGGGVRIRAGVDSDGDGKLSSGETRQTRYVCHLVAPAGPDAGADVGADASPDVAEVRQTCGNHVNDPGEMCCSPAEIASVAAAFTTRVQSPPVVTGELGCVGKNRLSAGPASIDVCENTTCGGGTQGCPLTGTITQWQYDTVQSRLSITFDLAASVHVDAGLFGACTLNVAAPGTQVSITFDTSVNDNQLHIGGRADVVHFDPTFTGCGAVGSLADSVISFLRTELTQSFFNQFLPATTVDHVCGQAADAHAP